MNDKILIISRPLLHQCEIINAVISENVYYTYIQIDEEEKNIFIWCFFYFFIKIYYKHLKCTNFEAYEAIMYIFTRYLLHQLR